MNLITKQSELSKFCAQVEHGAYITVDTEFIRDKTYFPKLCLVQIAGGEHAAAIDPLAEDINLEPVFALLQKPDLVKVFHACRQDIEIFYLLSGAIPINVFDTQIAASVCGYGESVSYETLVNKIVGQDLDKSSRFTDWSARPLSEKQLTYALSDVTHLRTIYEHLKAQIEEAGRTSWIAEEHAQLSDPALYQIEPHNAWKRLKYGTMRPKHLAVLRELAQWREIEARKNDVPRGRILKDESLVELASSIPRKTADLARMRSMDKNLSKSKADEVFVCVERALALPQTEWPQVSKSRKPPENITSLIAMLQLLLKVKADIHGIAASIIADKDDLEAVALGKTEIIVLQGWRYDVFGRKAQLLIEGKLKLSLNAKTKQVVFEEVEG
jgi:ribonuclease D